MTRPSAGNGHDPDPLRPHGEDELELLDANAIADLFKLKPAYVRRAARGPRKMKKPTRHRNTPPPIPSIKIGHYVRFQESAVRAWLEGLKRNYPNHFSGTTRSH